MTTDRVTGSCKWFDASKGFGFIKLDSGDDIFCHASAIIGVGFKSLCVGDRVELEIEEHHKGRRARRVRVVE